MDLLKVFESISTKLVAEFEQSKVINHNGGMGTYREDAFKDFLGDYLPRKYGLGKGEVISPENRVSGEMDIVIYDVDHCPRLIPNDNHSVFPIESVFGAISMKSHLDSRELADAYNNIVSLKSIVSKVGFNHSVSSGVRAGMNPAMPVTAIVAYSTNRSKEAIANQVKKLDEGLSDIKLRPDFIIILNECMIAPTRKYRGEFNSYAVPDDCSEIRRTGRHTLFKFYMNLLNELNLIQLPPLDLQKYFDMPVRIGKYLVKGRVNLIMQTQGEKEQAVRFKESFWDKVVAGSEKMTFKDAYTSIEGVLSDGADKNLGDLDRTVSLYNPRSCTADDRLAYVSELLRTGKEPEGYNVFSAAPFLINDEEYIVDLLAASLDDVDILSGLTAEELWAL